MRYQILHKTTYYYDSAVSVSHHVLRMTPRALPRQQVLEFDLGGDPQPTLVQSHADYFGNTTTFISVQGPHRQLAVTARSRVETASPRTLQPERTPPWESVRDTLKQPLTPQSGEAVEFSFSSPLVPQLPVYADYAAQAFQPGRPVLAAGIELMGRIHRDFAFDPSATTVATPVDEVFRTRRGVCQDFAHLQLACLRSLGLPARYLSGYIETVPPPGQPKLAGTDASHAWIQLWCGQEGWVDLDPTNDLLPAERHITVAWGRDYGDVSPLRGVLLGSGQHQLQVAVDVIPLLL